MENGKFCISFIPSFFAVTERSDLTDILTLKVKDQEGDPISPSIDDKLSTTLIISLRLLEGYTDLHYIRGSLYSTVRLIQ